ncbi:Uncharacterised protein [Chromobacterium violaceum]|uniref:Uncharacterized protein n=1 Tax=Chromobacterium violaceum TaxID=536 RepID=A0A447T507_CHRVL|nr:Uncharacterised protein [Chromobacterium violaceum]
MKLKTLSLSLLIASASLFATPPTSRCWKCGP